MKKITNSNIPEYHWSSRLQLSMSCCLINHAALLMGILLIGGVYYYGYGDISGKGYYRSGTLLQ